MSDDRFNIIEKVNKNKYVKKTKKSIISLFFSRAGVFALLILLQIAAMIYLYKHLKIDPSFLISGDTVLTIVIMLVILNMDSIRSSFKLSWFILIAIMPSFATIVFFLAYFSIGYKKEQKKILEIEKIIFCFCLQNITHTHTNFDIGSAYFSFMYMFNFAE